uniref:Uncharacterized protein n=1 Tax=Salix viminalis TaxID=40686 RepID=A0A6N2LFI5_SALVM
MKLMTMWKSLLLLSYRPLSGFFWLKKNCSSLNMLLSCKLLCAVTLYGSMPLEPSVVFRPLLKCKLLFVLVVLVHGKSRLLGSMAILYPRPLQKECSVIKPATTYISIEKLLRNSFALNEVNTKEEAYPHQV